MKNSLNKIFHLGPYICVVHPCYKVLRNIRIFLKIRKMILRTPINWFYSNDENTETCEEINFSDYPECSENEMVVFNDFAQPVCHCGPDTFPLEDPYSDQGNPDRKKCYLVGEEGPCSGQMLGMDLSNDSFGLLKCSKGSDLVPLCAISCTPGSKCGSGQVYAFGKCQKGVRRFGWIKARQEKNNKQQWQI